MSVAFPVIFTPRARAELIDAHDWYENEAPGLGRRFRAAVEVVIEYMSANPRQFPVIHKNVRRVIEADRTLTVIACFHGSRDPAHWKKRA